ncbi:hypothetical protein MPCS_00529 [Candidatus Megaera polyxenophila]|jgi:hypothetical protein|uniref:hypothetical protein n=1 Tax=Candidatus Megaera polyxenophila TaxID=988779 RepID=UPI001CC77507|nr:hypothetical protein [Candidatus Megaera polyxenophila]MBU6184399.1 hypothetical protein [Rickettsiales bacterium]MCC8461583.1 hypothetical protein [Candidatus Megaera polyxenophila]WHA06900.1 hypothetical protein N3Z16_01800 [Candidatus Megaera polyxenophila]BBB56547.1 hypothetical protein MPCS_00529 [Candidatus Megaera polyxenophila]
MAFVVTFLAVLSVIILMFIDKIIEYLYPKGSLSAVEKDLDNVFNESDCMRVHRTIE